MNDLLFQLIQVAIGNRCELTSIRQGSGQAHLSADEWASLRLEFKKQGMLGIGYVGITKLPKEQCPPIQILAQWVHNAEKIRKKNEKMNEECRKVCALLDHDGFYSCVLKGQSNLVNYPADLREYRTAGDIDVLCWPKGEIQIAEGDDKSAHYVTYKGRRAVIEYVLMQHRASLPALPRRESAIKDEMPEVQYHHVDWEYDGTPVEVHFRASWLNNPFANRRLQRWTEENMQFSQTRWGVLDKNQKNPSAEDEPIGFAANACASECSSELGTSYTQPSSAVCDTNSSSTEVKNSRFAKNQLEDTFPIPTASFNVVYQLVHINRHLFNEGIGLRQILDYYFVLKAWKEQLEGLASTPRPTQAMWEEGLAQSVPSKEQIMHTLRCFNLGSFASAVMWVLQEAFAMPSEYLLCPPDEKRGHFLLNEIMLAGNFGRYDERNVIAANESYVHRFIRRQKRFLRFLTQYPSEVLWAPYFSVTQRLWRMWHGWR